MRKTNLTLDKPIFIGFTRLELSKLHMYKLYYDNFKLYYKYKCSLLYCDTDLLYLNIETSNLCSNLKTYFSEVIDFSNFPEVHPLHNLSHLDELGLLKFKTIDSVRTFIGLKAKTHCFLTETACKEKAKGDRSTALESVNFNAYKNILFGESFRRQKQYSILSKQHELNAVVANKVSLSA